ncbi:hypothetical protein CWI37_0424p0040 [Hamiltosporidium tvaerminnensis]|uniref:Uncharacterized protein n=1 Tax=Hamiltosporidium tvaerminnensis TaxID=1176355 RepID=A0A4Q9L585_9MICR|nr:hypothetical protein CWI37_0424p0040 [Hamiltosporidium tvaerminnensis]
MNLNEKYLLSLLSKYYFMGNEKYILSRLRLIEVSMQTRSIFCCTCLYLYIPSVNCKIYIDSCIFEVVCYGCNGKLRINLEKLDASNVLQVSNEKIKFNDFFF